MTGDTSAVVALIVDWGMGSRFESDLRWIARNASTVDGCDQQMITRGNKGETTKNLRIIFQVTFEFNGHSGLTAKDCRKKAVV